MRRFYAASLPAPGQATTLDPLTSHHLLRVTGVAPGERVELFDGQGRACFARLLGVQGGLAALEATEPVREGLPLPERVLVVGLPRKPAWELALRMITELGVTEVRPFVARRSVATGEHTERWERIVQEAARQCGRADFPRLRPLAPLAEQLRELPGGARYTLTPGAPSRSRAVEHLCLLLGPEGGLTDAEQDLAAAQGFIPAGLGPLTLRADTALVVGLAVYALGAEGG